MSDSRDLVMLVVNDRPFHLSDIVRSLSVDGNWQLFERFVRRQIIVQLGERAGIVPSTEDIQREVDEWRYENQLERVEDTEAWLTRFGITLHDVAVEAEYWLYERGLMSQITDESIRVFFVRNSVDFESAEISWIVVSAEGVAEEICVQVREEDASFHSLARRYSMDEDTRPAGGYLGRRRRTDLPDRAASLVFAAPEGHVVGPIKVEIGYALYYVEQRCPAMLDQNIRCQIRRKLFDSKVEREIKRAEIKYPFTIG